MCRCVIFGEYSRFIFGDQILGEEGVMLVGALLNGACVLQAFFVDIFTEVLGAHPGPSHASLASLHASGALQRHYTMNIDGLASAVGMDTWHNEENPKGSIVEMHGNIRCEPLQLFMENWLSALCSEHCETVLEFLEYC